MNRKTSMLLTAALGLSLAAFPVYAQNGPPRPGNAPGHHQHMSMEQRFSKVLKLTPAQQSKINPILKSPGEQLRAIHKNKKLTPEQKRAQSMKIFESVPGKINKYLDKTQQAKLQQMVDRFKNFKGRGKDGHQPGTPPQHQ